MNINDLKIAIDGPSAAGKSTMANLLSQRTGIPYINSGRYYRAVAVLIQRMNLSVTPDICDFLSDKDISITQDGNHISVRCWDKFTLIGKIDESRDDSITEMLNNAGEAASIISSYKTIRQIVNRELGKATGSACIMEGRDIASVVMPDADVKIFLDADLAIRSRRRMEQNGCNDYKKTLKEISLRDERDREREESPLKQVPEAIYVNSSNVDISQTLETLYCITLSKLYGLRNFEKDIRYLKMADIWAGNSYCTRLKVGAIIVKNGSVISDGYNGTPSGFPNVCEYVPKGEEISVTLPYVLHAEANAITKLARGTVSSIGATLYLTHAPCLECSKLIIQAGIKRVVYITPYRITQGIELLERAGIVVEMIKPDIAVKMMNLSVGN